MGVLNQIHFQLTTPSFSYPSLRLGSYDGLLEVLLMGIVSVAGFYLLYRKSQRHLDKANPQKLNIFKRLAQPNCSKCRFFDRNSYLKCAVHPVRVSNIEAQNCPDYWQRDRRKFLHH